MKGLKEDFGRALANIRRTLTNLAAPATKQLDYLRDIGDQGKCADELALEFDDDFIFFKQFIADRRVARNAAQDVSAVAEQLSRMSGRKNARLWTVAALSSSTEWAEVRKLAAQALSSLPKQTAP